VLTVTSNRLSGLLLAHWSVHQKLNHITSNFNLAYLLDFCAFGHSVFFISVLVLRFMFLDVMLPVGLRFSNNNYSLLGCSCDSGES